MSVHLLVGPHRHGVVAHGLRIAAAGRGRTVHVATPAQVPDLRGDRVIVQFTDRLFGSDATEAAETLLARTADAGRRVLVLHDLPQESDGRHQEVRSAAYARLARAADAVVVASEHEAGLLGQVAPGVTPTVLPLPLERWGFDSSNTPAAQADPVVATLGFIYPGKGLEEVIDACAATGRRVTVCNLGACSEGHDDLVARLTDRAAAQGLSWSTSGWLDERALRSELLRVAVPVAAHRHLSASGSINSWLEAGRRPLVTASSYAVELASRAPGCLTVVADSPSALRDAITRALDDPRSTWLGDTPLGPTPAECATVLERLADQ